MLTLTGIGRHYPGGIVALDDVSLSVAGGEFLVLLGPSGCGKSTLLRLIAGLEPPSAGTLAWHSGPPAPGEMGYVFQDPVLMPWASALDNVALPLRLRGFGRQSAALAADALAMVGLAAFAQARPRALSGGMRMRVSIARALVSRPRLLLMDEPFAALDEFTRQQLQDQCLALTRELGCTTIFVTHSLYEAATLASRIIVLSPRPGRIAAELPGTQGARTGRAFTDQVARLTRATQGPAFHQ